MSKTNTRMLLRCAVFAALTAVGAFIRIPFALSSITLQFFFTAMAGLVLGARWGAASQAIYVLLGLAGLPIFSAGGGAGYIFYPSFGFLLGLIPAAYVTGRLCGGCKRPSPVPPVYVCCIWWGCRTWRSYSAFTVGRRSPSGGSSGTGCLSSSPATR